jgi:hypothetical protein
VKRELLRYSLVAALAAGCAKGVEDGATGGSNSAPAAGGASDPPGSFPDAPTYCKARARAECTDAVALACGAKSTADCAVSREAYCNSAVPQGSELLSENVPACLAIVSAAYADGTLEAEEIRAMHDACDARCFSGPGQTRATCTTDRDCRTRDGLICIVPRNATSGRCLAPRPIPPGGPCPNEADVCAQGYFCDDSATQCVAFGHVGDACGLVHPCAPELAPCSGGGPFGSTCQEKLRAGRPCKKDGDCADGVCDKLENIADGTCAAAIVLAKPDAACATFR